MAQGRRLDAPVTNGPTPVAQEGLQSPLVGLAVLEEESGRRRAEPPGASGDDPAEQDLGLHFRPVTRPWAPMVTAASWEASTSTRVRSSRIAQVPL